MINSSEIQKKMILVVLFQYIAFTISTVVDSQTLNNSTPF